MEVNDVLKKTLNYIHREEVQQILDHNPEVTPTAEDGVLLENLVFCLNSVLRDIAQSYLELACEQEVVVTNKKIELSELDYKATEILNIKTLEGFEVGFKVFPDYIAVPNGWYRVRYNYLPENVMLNGSLPGFYGKIDENILAFGVAFEHFLLEGLYQDAQIWEGRFKNALMSALRPRRNIKLKKRGWF